MAKWCFNYDSGEYEYIDRNGFSFSSGNLFLTGITANIKMKKMMIISFGKMTI